jgi:HD-like signal output (HDOD) protein
MSASSPQSTRTPHGERLHARLAGRVEDGSLELPVLSDTATRVMAVCGDSRCDARGLAELIQRDPSLAGHVVRVANSAAYAPREPIVSVQQAVNRLGFATVCDIALAVSLQGKVFNIAGRERSVREMWVHSATAGAWAKEIARLKRRNVEGAFLSGLLHDIGRPVLLQAALEIAAEPDARACETDIQSSIDELHALVSAGLLARWSLPEWMASAVRWHHAPESAPAQPELAATVCLADLLAHKAMVRGAVEDEFWTNQPSLRVLGIYPDELAKLLEARDQVVRVAGALA